MLLKKLLTNYATVHDAGPQTILQYGVVVSVFSKFLNRKATTGDLTVANVEAFRIWYTGLGRKSSTVNGKLQVLGILADYGIRKKHRCEDLTEIRRATVEKRVPDSWTPAEVGRIFAAAKAEKDYCGWGGPEWYALLQTFYYAGARRHAMLTRKKTDLRQRENGGWYIRLAAEDQKCDNEQIVSVAQEAVDAIREMRPNESELLFPIPYGDRSIYNAIKRIVKNAGLPCSRRDMLHKLRRTTATQIAKVHGVDQASYQLGHTSPAQTRMHYIDPRELMVDTSVGVARPTILTGE